MREEGEGGAGIGLLGRDRVVPDVVLRVEQPEVGEVLGLVCRVLKTAEEDDVVFVAVAWLVPRSLLLDEVGHRQLEPCPNSTYEVMRWPLLAGGDLPLVSILDHSLDVGSSRQKSL